MLTGAQPVACRGRRVSGATLDHTGRRSHTQAGQSLWPQGAKGSVESHSGREISEGHIGTDTVSGGHTGSRIGRVTPSAVAGGRRAGGRTSHGESGRTAQVVRSEGDAARAGQAHAAEYQVVSVALCVNVALGPRVQLDSAPGPFPGHTLLGQLQLEGGTAPLGDGHILQRPQHP